ncbi:MAG: hypothetical protein Q9P14_00690 [candidate division KSB1 bacterium]|nr:hypothetical protein [candidate division KSB1 bacterium]MDQ7066354.1 hypothetical protein [candidate division KSB1 bacterium]
MLITFSGVVGSGKSTNAKKARRMIESMGFEVIYLRFRFVSWRWLFKPISAMKTKKNGDTKQRNDRTKQAPEALRSGKFEKLNFLRFSGYLWRMLVFRMLLAMKLDGKIVITDRYYYDNFSHYFLSGPMERLYLAILKRALPRPDLAFFLMANERRIVERRPHYDPDYLVQLCHHYSAILHRFPELVPINTDRFDTLDEIIAQNIKRALCTVFKTAVVETMAPGLKFRQH